MAKKNPNTQVDALSGLDGFPSEILSIIGQYTSINRADPNERTRDEPENFASYSPMLFNATKLSRLSTYITDSELEKAKYLLSQNPSLINGKTQFNDMSGRTFTCTAFEYAYWAKDTFMCQMILDIIDQLPPMEAQTIQANLLKQINQIEDEKQGLICTQNQLTRCIRPFSLEPLKVALKTYIGLFNGLGNVEPEEWDHCYQQADNYLLEVVGLAQQDLPAHIRQLYCDRDTPFSSNPQFTSPSSKPQLEFYNSVTHQNQIWDASFAESKGKAAILGSNGTSPAIGLKGCKSAVGAPARAVQDFKSITLLDRVKTNDLHAIKQRLEQALFEPKQEDKDTSGVCSSVSS